MSETKKRLLEIIKSMPEELYNSGYSSKKIIMELAKKYYELYGDEELRPFVEEYIKHPDCYRGI